MSFFWTEVSRDSGYSPIILPKDQRKKLKLLKVFTSSGCCNNVPETDWLEGQNFIVSQFWQVEVKTKVWAALRPSEGCCAVPFRWLLVVCHAFFGL